MLKHRLTRSASAATALALSLSLAACGDDADQEPEAAATSASPTGTASSEATAGPSRPPRSESSVVLAVTVSGGDVTPTAETLEMSKGDTLLVRVTSDRAGELHVHSTPEQYVEFGQGRTQQRLSFDQPGQVDIEEHDSGALVARVLVQ